MKKILIVEDDRDFIKETADLLSSSGYEAVAVSEGKEAVKKIEEEKPDLIILDLMLPRYGGFEILRQLQAGDTSKIPIVVVTGRYTDRSTSEMIKQESNVVEFMEKPVKPAILGALLHTVLKTQPAMPKNPG